MNDFTKEELFEILGLASNAYGIKGRIMPLIVKLQSMIDSYCEHEWNTEVLIKKIISNPGEAFPVECKKCGLPYRC